MATNRTASAFDHASLSATDRAAIERVLQEPGIALNADELAALLAAGGDDEVRALLASGLVAEALGLLRFNIAEATFNWDEPRNQPCLDDEPLH